MNDETNKKIDTTKLKPYTIENAKNGDKAIIVWAEEEDEEITSPIKVVGISVHTNLSNEYPIYATFIDYSDKDEEWNHETFKEDGRYTSTSSRPSLFVAPKIVTKWVNIYKYNDSKSFDTGCIHDSREGCEAKAKLNCEYVKTISFEIEE